MQGPQDREEDAALMARVARGEAEACRLLVRLHLRPLLGLAQRMTGNPSDAEDIAQEAFARLWRQSSDWKPQARISTWLYRVAHNLSIDSLRRQKRLEPGNGADCDIEDPAQNQSTLLHQQEVAAQVEAAMGQLPERQRTAITLVHHRDLSNKEAAEIMDISVDALESLLSRGRRGLKTLLEKQREDLLGAET